VIAIGTGFTVALASSYLAVWLGPRLRIIDAPGDDSLKVHTLPTPLLGGVGVFAGVHAGMFIAGAGDGVLLAGTAPILLLGLADDRFGLSPLVRIVAELAVAILLVGLMGDELRHPAGFVFGVVLILAAINAVNLFDGLDALVGSTAFVSALGLAWAGAAGYGDWRLGASLAAALAGFLVLNRPQAKIFLGDNGAYTVGVILAYGSLRTIPEGSGSMLLIAAGVLGVFALDLSVTVVRRARTGTRMFGGDRAHVYDQLHRRGWSTVRVVMAETMLQVILIAVFVGYAVSGPGFGGAIVVIGALGLITLATAWRSGYLDVVD